MSLLSWLPILRPMTIFLPFSALFREASPRNFRNQCAVGFARKKKNAGSNIGTKYRKRYHKADAYPFFHLSTFHISKQKSNPLVSFYFVCCRFFLSQGCLWVSL
ncbi:hypothetical protein V8C37DRAFT_140760 [Trichoderma ceciliae]